MIKGVRVFLFVLLGVLVLAGLFLGFGFFDDGSFAGNGEVFLQPLPSNLNLFEEVLNANPNVNFQMAHPRLPHPDSAYLTRVQANANYYNNVVLADANNFNPGLWTHQQLFNTIIAAMITQNSQYISQLVQVASQNAPIGESNPIPGFTGYVGTDIYFRASIFDWLYNNLNQAQRDQIANKIEQDLTTWEGYQSNKNPFNAVYYNRQRGAIVWGAIALYGEHSNANFHFQQAGDNVYNFLLPAWRETMKGGTWHEGLDYVDRLHITTTAVLSGMTEAFNVDMYQQEDYVEDFVYFPVYNTLPNTNYIKRGDTARISLYGFTNIPNYLGFPTDYDGSHFPTYLELAHRYNNPYAYWIYANWPGGAGQSAPSTEPLKPSWYFPYTPGWPENSPQMINPYTDPNFPLHHYLDGSGKIVAVSDWTEDRVTVEFGIDRGWWSHSGLDTGNFLLEKRGALAIKKGIYDGISSHARQLYYQGLSNNVMLFIDSADISSNYNLNVNVQGATVSQPYHNDGFTKRHRSDFPIPNPLTMQERIQREEEFDFGSFLNIDLKDDYVYALADLTPAYTPTFNLPYPNPSPNNWANPATERTERFSKTNPDDFYERTWLYIRPDLFIVLDRYDMVSNNIRPIWTLNSINQPIVQGNTATITRNENVFCEGSFDCAWPSSLQHTNNGPQGNEPDKYYQYDGKLRITHIQTGNNNQFTIIGGPGQEFQNIEGTYNYNECAATSTVSCNEMLSPNPARGIKELGSWRLQLEPTTINEQDALLNIMQLGTASTTFTPVTSITINSGNYIGARFTTENQEEWAVLFNKGRALINSLSYNLNQGNIKNMILDLEPNKDYTIMIRDTITNSIVQQLQTSNSEGILRFELIINSNSDITIDSGIINIMTIANKENFAVTNYPLQFGRPFVQGEVPAGFVPQVFVDGAWMQTQVDVKNRWPDGSLKFAVFSLVVSQLNAGQIKTITFQNIDEAVYQSGVGNNPMTPAQILNMFGEFDAKMELSNSGGTHIVSARQIISDALADPNVIKYWNSGPVVTSVVLGDHSANARYDVGWKQRGTKLSGNLCPPTPQNPGPEYNCGYSSTDNVFYVNDASWINVNDVLNVNDELVFVQSVNVASNPNSITIQRGYGGLPYSHGGLAAGVFVTSNVWQPLNLPADESYRSFRPVFEVDFWQNLGRYEVRFIGEIANTEKLQDLEYDVVLKTGKTIISTKLTQTGVTQHYGSRWSRSYFDGSYVLPSVEIDYNLDYLSETGFVYDYDSSIQVPDFGTSTFCTNNGITYNGWSNSNKDLMKLGLWSTGAMGAGGNRHELGADVPCWDALWLNSMDWRAGEMTLGQAELAASWPVHFREGMTGKVFDRNPSTGQPGTLSGLGRVVSPNARPTLVLSDPVKYFSNYNTASDRINFVSRFTNGEISLSTLGLPDEWKVGLGHYYNPFSISYLLSGKHFFNEEILFWGSYTALGPAFPRGPNVDWAGRGGGLTDPYATRYQARPMVGRLWASLFAVDGTPEKELFDGLINDAIVVWMGMQNIPISAQPEIQGTQWNQQMWQFGRDMYSLPVHIAHGNPPLPSPLNFWIYGNPGACASPVNIAAARSCESPWMISPMLADTLGKADDLGYPVDRLIEFISVYFSWHFSAGSSPYTLGAYREGSVNVNNIAFSSPAEVFNAFETSYQNSPCFQQGNGCGPPYDIAQSDGYFSVAMAAAARMYDINTIPYDWFRQEAQSTYSAGVYNKDPRYAIVPRVQQPACQGSNCPPNAPTGLMATLQ